MPTESEDTKPPKPPGLDDPAQRRRVVRLLLMLTPAMFVFCYLLAWMQGAETRHAVLIAAVGAGMSLAAAAASIHVMGSKSIFALIALKVGPALAAKKLGPRGHSAHLTTSCNHSSRSILALNGRSPFPRSKAVTPGQL